MKIKYTLIIIVLFSPSIMALEDEHLSAWKGEAEIGYISTAGNSNTETLNLKAKVSHEHEKWKNTAILNSTKIADKNTVTANRYTVSVQSNYKLNNVSYMFGLLSHEDDKFSGYDYQSSLVFGYGYKVINEEKLRLDAEVGAGGRNKRLSAGIIQSESVLHAGLNLTWKISKFSEFEQILSFEGSDSSDTIKSATSLKTKINSQLASKITYNVKHVSTVPVGIKNLDKQLAVTLVYSY